MVLGYATNGRAGVELTHPNTFFLRIEGEQGLLEVEIWRFEGLQFFCRGVLWHIFRLSRVSLVLQWAEGATLVDLLVEEV